MSEGYAIGLDGTKFPIIVGSVYGVVPKKLRHGRVG